MSTTPTYRKYHRGARYREQRAIMFATYGRVCHLCHHDGANDADYLVPPDMDPTQGVHWYNMRPAHGSTSRCPVCKQCCNTSKGNKKHYEPLIVSQAW